MSAPLNSFRVIDLREEERGTLCVVCEESPAQMRDPDMGPACLDCCIEGLRAERALKESLRKEQP